MRERAGTHKTPLERGGVAGEPSQVGESSLVWESRMRAATTLLNLCPMAGKRCPHHGGRLTRPPSMTIAAGTQARCHVMSVVPAYEVLCL